MIEGGGSRNYIETKQHDVQRYRRRGACCWTSSSRCSSEYCRQQVQAGADVIQIFDSWVGSLSLADYRDYAFEASKRLVRAVQAMGVPVIYFGVETAGLLRADGGDGRGRDRAGLAPAAGRRLARGGPRHAVQGNLDPITLFAPLEILEQRVKEILRAAGGRPGTSSTSATALFPDAGRECAGGGAHGPRVPHGEARMAKRGCSPSRAWNAGDCGADSRVSAQRGQRAAACRSTWSRRSSTAIR